MAMASLEYIEVDEKGVARIAGSRIKVTHLVQDKQIQGWSPEEIQEQYPHLPLSAIYAAFAYYYDHKEECDHQIQESLEYAEQMRKQAGESPIRKRLKDMGRL